MTHINVELPYGHGKVEVKIPQKNLLKILVPSDIPPVINQVEAIKKAVENPIGSQPIPKLVQSKKAKNAVIIISDLTRLVPDNIIVPILLDKLNEAGIPPGKVTVLVATGTHPPPAWKELKNRLGEELVNRVKIEIHNAKDDANLVYIGKTSVGNDIYINRIVTEADIKIGTGSIIPHIIAGYSGGRKIILPGVAGVKTIQYNHSFKFVLHPNARPGVIHDNPISKDMEDAARLARLDFIVNVVLNAENEICYVVAGDPYEAWKAGVEVADKIYKTKLTTTVPILITDPGGYPFDIDLYQSLSKGVNPFWHVVQDRGVVILVARCNGGVGDKLMEQWLIEAKTPEDVINRGKSEGLKLGPHVAWFTCYKVLRRAKIILVSDMPDDLVNKLLMTPAEDVETALNMAFEITGKESKIAVIPSATKVVVEIQS